MSELASFLAKLVKAAESIEDLVGIVGAGTGPTILIKSSMLSAALASFARNEASRLTELVTFSDF